MRRCLVLSLLVFGLAAPADAHAATLYTTPTGAGTACAESAPCAIRTAITQGTVADTIRVAAGSYPVLQGDTPVDARMVGVPEGRARPTINLDTEGFDLRSGGEFLDIRGGSSTTLVRIYGDSSDLDVRNLGEGGCSVRDGAQLTNSLCKGRIIGASVGGVGGGLTNVTGIARASDPNDEFGGVVIGGGPLTLRNVIADGLNHDLFVGASTRATIDTSAYQTVLQDPGGSPQLTVRGRVDVPGFAGSETFRPVAGSTAIDAGSVGAGVGGVDLDGNARIVGAQPDIGAFERVQAGPAVLSGAATDVTTTSATLHATITTGGGFTSWTWAPVGGAPAVSGADFAPGSLATRDATLPLTGLQPGTTYAYDVVARNDFGETAPVRVSATTAAAPGGGGDAGGGDAGGGAGGGGGGGTGTGGGATPGVGPVGGGAAPGTPAPEGVRFQVVGPSHAAARALVRRGRAAKVRVTCPTACGARMRGELRAGKRRLGTVAVPAGVLRIGAGGRGTLSVKASKALRKRARSTRKRLTLVLRVATTRDGADRDVTTLRVRAS